jgi:hypothetical protein
MPRHVYEVALLSEPLFEHLQGIFPGAVSENAQHLGGKGLQSECSFVVVAASNPLMLVKQHLQELGYNGSKPGSRPNSVENINMKLNFGTHVSPELFTRRSRKPFYEYDVNLGGAHDRKHLIDERVLK